MTRNKSRPKMARRKRFEQHRMHDYVSIFQEHSPEGGVMYKGNVKVSHCVRLHSYLALFA